MKQTKFIPMLIFILFIGGFSVLNILQKDRSFSEFENRPLTQFPKFTVKKLLEGTFTEQFETYVTDQFFGKTFWTALKAKAEQSILKQENNDVYFGKDDYLFEKPEELTAQLQKNIDYVNQFQSNNEHFPMTFVLAPTSIDIYPEKLPPFSKEGKHEEIVNLMKESLHTNIQLINPFHNLRSKKEEAIYFRTDHHWTMRGAFYAYEAVANKMGFRPYSLDDFQITSVSHQFYGTFYAKGNDLTVPADTIDVFQPDAEIQYKVEADDELILESLYDEDFLNKRDQYSYFLGGNHAKTIITSSVKNGQKLLLIKDSYAHAFVPFLANHFEEIHLLDLRYYHANIQQYIEEQKLTEGLILYNSSNFSKDRSIIYLKQ